MARQARAPAARDARRKITHAQILEAAARQMNRRGAAATLLKDVAAELGVTRMALYRYAEDREDLVYQCYLRTCDVLAARLEGVVGDDAAETVARFIGLALKPDEPEVCAVVEHGLLPPEKGDEVRRRFDALVARLAAILEAGAARGQLRACDFTLVAQALLNVAFWVPVADFWNVVKLDRDRALMNDLARDFIFYGWAADRRSAPSFVPIDLTAVDGPAVEAFDRESLAEAKREKILQVASRLFNEKGIDSATLDDVARELGATSGAISHNVGDKPTLAAACYLRTLRLAMALRTTANARSGPALNRNTAFEHAWALVLMRRWPLMPLTGFESLPVPGQQAFHELVPPLTELTLALAREGEADGSMRPLHRYATRLHSGIVGWLARAAIRDPARQDAVAQEMAALSALGIKPLA